MIICYYITKSYGEPICARKVSMGITAESRQPVRSEASNYKLSIAGNNLAVMAIRNTKDSDSFCFQWLRSVAYRGSITDVTGYGLLECLDLTTQCSSCCNRVHAMIACNGPKRIRF